MLKSARSTRLSTQNPCQQRQTAGTQRVNRPTGQPPGAFASHCGWAPRVSDPVAGEVLRRPLLTGSEPSVARGVPACSTRGAAPTGTTALARQRGGPCGHSGMLAGEEGGAKFGPHLDDGSRWRAQTTEVDEAELLAARIGGWCGGAGARRRRSASASLAAQALLLLLRSERQGGGEVKWRSGVACAR